MYCRHTDGRTTATTTTAQAVLEIELNYLRTIRVLNDTLEDRVLRHITLHKMGDFIRTELGEFQQKDMLNLRY